MPFTFCHPAIILPLTKSKNLSTSALIIGSTAPDFEYFIRMDLIRTHSHDFWSIFYFNIPITILLYFIFQLIVKTPLINNSTSFFYNRFNRFKAQKQNLLSLKNLIIIILSAGIGNFSHLLWDSFTHKEGFFEGQLPFLLESFHFLNKDVVVFQFLQTWSSIIGGLYILYFIYKMPVNQVENKSNFLQFWIIALSVSLTVIFIRQCQNGHQFIATSISSGFIGVILSSIYFQKKLKNQHKC